MIRFDRRLILLVAISGCGPGLVLKPPRAPIVTSRIAAMPASVEIYEWDFYGKFIPKPDWTAAGLRNVNAAIETIGEANGVEVFDETNLAGTDISYGSLWHWADRALGEIHKQAYGDAPRVHQSVADWRFDLGRLDQWQTALDADYVLFVRFRDAHMSTGAAIASAFSNIHKSPIQGGTACLIDLRDGQVCWCETVSDAYGDLRTPSPARTAVNTLLRRLLPNGTNTSPPRRHYSP